MPATCCDLDAERQVAARARAGGALRAALARVAHAPVECRAWERLGYARLGDYACERLGQSGGTVLGGGDAPENRVTLCALHHLRGVHAGLVRLRGSAPDGLRFDLPLESYLPGERRTSRVA